jgi:hypothetical protein
MQKRARHRSGSFVKNPLYCAFQQNTTHLISSCLEIIDMSDNKLKIRIKIQQPQPHAIEESYANPEIVYEQVWDWKKIGIGVLFALSLLVLMGSLLFTGESNKKPQRAEQNEFPVSAPGETPVVTAKPDEQSEAAQPIAAPPSNQAATASKPVVKPARKPVPKNIANRSNAAEKEIPKETLIHSANEMKHEAHGTQQPRHIDKIGEGASTAQRSDSLVQPINQRFPKTAARPKPRTTSDRPEVLRAQLSHAIKAREPVDSIDAVQLRPGESKSVYFYVHLKNLQGQKIHINWYYNNKPDSHLSLQVHNNNWRTQASKQLDYRRLGVWRVELTDEAENRLATRHFTVAQH